MKEKGKRMFGWIVILIGSLIFGSCAAQAPNYRYISSQNKIERLNHSVVALVTPTPETMREMGITHEEADRINTLGEVHRSYCSGFWISSHEVVTAAHCVQRTEVVNTIFGEMRFPIDESPVGDLKKVTSYNSWRSTNHEFRSYKIFEVTEYNRLQDVALLTLTLAQVPPSYFVALEIGSEPQSGERVYLVGHPAGQPWSLTEGIVSHPLRRRGNGKLVTQASAQIYFGNSGGPLINNRGQAVGVASTLITPHLAFFSHVQSINRMLDGR